jgi:hypothetical protein
VLAADKMSTSPREFTFTPLRMEKEQGLTNHQSEYGVAEELETFIIFFRFGALSTVLQGTFVGQRSMGQGADQQLGMNKTMPERFFEFSQIHFQSAPQIP